MPPPDDHAEYYQQLARTLLGLDIAIEHSAPAMEILGHICLLVNEMIEQHHPVGFGVVERPSDAALRRAVGQLWR